MMATGFRDLIEVVADLGNDDPDGPMRDIYRECHRRVIIGFKP